MSGTVLVRRRIRVNAPIRVSARSRESVGVLVGLSATTALVVLDDPLAEPGDTLELHLPTFGGAEIPVLAGVDKVDRIYEGIIYSCLFMVAEPAVRKSLDALLGLLLRGDGGGLREHARVAYAMPIHFGEMGRAGELVDLSLGGLSMNTPTALTVGSSTRVRIPRPSLHGWLELHGTVMSCRMSGVQAYRVGLRFEDLVEPTRSELEALLTELLRR